MYNPQLNTFLIAAKAGSFSKASKELYVSSSAVLQQINGLEERLGVSLFERTNRGLTLTAAGAYLLNETNHLTAWDKAVKERLRTLDKDSADRLRVGVPRMHRSRLFYEYWVKYSAVHPEKQLEFIEAEGNAPEQINKAYRSVDLIEFIYTNAEWAKDFDFLKLCDIPLAFAVPTNHPLAARPVIALQELSGQKIIATNEKVFSGTGKYLRQLGMRGAELSESEIYSTALMARCIAEGRLLLVPYCSLDIHPMMKTIRCEWDASIPYGFYYSAAAAAGEASFLSFVREEIARYPVSVFW